MADKQGDGRQVLTIQTPAAKRSSKKHVEVISILQDGAEPEAFDVYLVMAEKERAIPLQKMWDRFCKSYVKRETGLLIDKV